MSDVKYHINPETGNANQCKAMYKCRFNMSDAEHYETKEEAIKGAEISLASENIDTDKYVSLIEKNSNFYNNDNRDFDLIQYQMKKIQEDDRKYWSEVDKENLYRLEKISSIVNKKKLSEDDWCEVENLSKHMKPSIHQKTMPWIKDEGRGDSIRELGKGLIKQRRIMDIPEPDPAPERDVNDRIIGLREAQLENFNSFNKTVGSSGKTIMGDSAINYFDKTLDRVANGEEYDGEDEHYFTPKHDRFMNRLENENQLYLATAFPDNELKKEMDRENISNVSVSPFENGREWGNAYTVMSPDGNTRTFSVYEHRNTDSIIINGTTNWNGTDLPYAADSKNLFYAEISGEERQRAAKTLTYFMKEAQNGTLDNDETLIRNAPRLDWNAILSEKLPGFAEWKEEHFPTPEKDKNLSEEDSILKSLDFDSEY